MLRAIAVDVVMRPDELLELIAHGHAGTLGRQITIEHHDTSTGVRETFLQGMSEQEMHRGYVTCLE